ncbi:MAG: hypothetical protein IKM83_00135 [Paludibacteraceae bacterium]|nr:hypothetical protein [Paludibacteraceae bacterium]
MGKVKYATGIDYVKGSLSKPKVRNGHSCGTYLTGTHREAATTNPNCTRLYIREANAYQRSTPVTADEVAKRNRFGAISQAVQARLKDLSKISADQQAFLAQKDEPGGKKTMLSYIWSLEKVVYDQAHS